MTIGRRHDVILVLGRNAFDEFGLLGDAFNNNRTSITDLEGKFLPVETEGSRRWRSRGRVRPVALIAIFGQDRLNVVIEVDSFRNRGESLLGEEKGDPALHLDADSTMILSKLYRYFAGTRASLSQRERHES